MYIELRGVEFKNKGAELMLMAILQKVKSEFPKAVFVMERRPSSATIKQQRSVGIYTKLNIKKYGINTAVLGLYIPKFLRHKLGFVHESEINVILDASGFAFGDFWGAEKAGQRLANHIVKWKKKGKKVILLPQAFGAFKDKDLQDKMQIIINNADLIFARDKYSLQYLRELNNNSPNIEQKPDFTNIFNGQLPTYFKNRDKHIAIIPNYKLVETGVFNSLDQYIDTLIRLVEKIRNQKFIPFFLNHEGKRDLMLMEEANNKLKEPIEIINEQKAPFIKGIIGASAGVITARFHGLVSALSQSVPCLCLGWSHKYEALLEEYNYSSALLKLSGDGLTDAILDKKIEQITNSLLREENIRILNNAAKKQKEYTELMWKKVFTTMRKGFS